MVLFNYWHVIASASSLETGKIHSQRLLEQDLVLWRDAADRALVWKDNCPHRGASLSRGWIEQNTLICPYHGLAYDNSGQCVRIPAHPNIKPPDRAHVRTFPTREQYGLIWSCLGNPESNIPAFPEWDDRNYRKFLCGPYHYRTSGFRALENFLDIAHFPFVHDGILGDRQHPIVDDYQVEMREDGIILRDVRVWQPDPDGMGCSGYVSYIYRVLSPLTAYLAKESANRRFTIFFSVTPIEEEECLGWMWLAMNYGREIPEKTLREFQDLIVSQDIPTVESQRPRRLPLNNDAEFHLPSDRASLAYRKWLKQLGVKFGTIF